MKGKEGMMTESFLAQELGLEEKAPVAARTASNTIAWWQERRVGAVREHTVVKFGVQLGEKYGCTGEALWQQMRWVGAA